MLTFPSFCFFVAGILTSHRNAALTKGLTGFHGSVLRFQHGAVIPLGKCQQACHKQSQDCIIVKGNRLNKDIHTGYIGDSRIVELCLNQRNCGNAPADDRNHGTDRGCGAVQNVSKFFSGYTKSLSQRLKDRSYDQRVSGVGEPYEQSAQPDTAFAF